AIMMEQGELPRDAKQVLATYDKACDKGDARACSNAGFMYINGDGAPLDQEMGRALFEKSCTMKHGEGCYNLGNVHESGAGVEKDTAKALEYYTLACSLDHKKACDAVKAAKNPKKGGKKK
ncbi:MAG TPA: tetratricopeptide repeat protein, partial [bacterium]|nr:tetratricopeptide repeat protein [bacterium]